MIVLPTTSEASRNQMLRLVPTRLLRLLLAATVAASLSGCIGPADTVNLPVADLAGPRLLVIAPHPDDETVGTGGAIAMARQRGWAVTVVFVTSGDGFWQAVRRPRGPMPTPAQMQAYGASRAAEARRATTALGVPASDVIFLGFPDGSMHFMWGTNWEGPPVLGMNGARSVPYAFALKPGAAYTGAELDSELEQIVKRVRPTTVLLPDAADVHRDHWAVGAFTQMALVRSGYSGLALSYLVHRTGFPTRRDSRPNELLAPPSAVLGDGTHWLSLPVSESARQAQSAALSDYASQLRADGPLVRSFVRPNEVLGLAPSEFIGTGTVTMPESTHDSVFRVGQPAAYLRAIELARGDASATVTLQLVAPVKPSIVYAVHIRAIGAGGAIRFYDAIVSGGKLSATRISKESVAGRGQLLAFGGRQVRIELPAELLGGAEWLFVGADTYAGMLTADHGAWRLVRVLPR